jgi:Rrf2 family protein
MSDTGIAVSLVAELDEHVVGFALGRVFYGEFGVVEPAAVLDVLGVHPDYRGRRVAAALVDQLRTNLLALGIPTLQTEVPWTNTELITFSARGIRAGAEAVPGSRPQPDAHVSMTKSSRYALYAAAEMAVSGEAPTTVAAVSERYGIPEGALAKVFQQLVRAGIALGTRGIGGGYRLARPASKVTVLDVLHVFERRRDPGGCLLHDRPGQACPKTSVCHLHWLFGEVDELVRSTYESVTLKTLVRRAARR